MVGWHQSVKLPAQTASKCLHKMHGDHACMWSTCTQMSLKQTRKPSCHWQTRAMFAKSLHGLRKSSGVVSCIASLPIDSVPMVSYYVLYTNCVCKMRCFGDTRLLKLPWPWNPGQGSLKVIESDTIQYLAYGFLLQSHSNFVSKMHRFRDMTTHWSKIAEKIQPTLIWHIPLGWPLANSSMNHTSPETRVMGLSDGVHFMILLSLC